jgi:WD40 repeat protein
VAFAPDGHTLATAGRGDSTVILWEITDPAAPRRLGSPLTGHTGGVFAVAFARKGHTLATAGSDATLLWDTTDAAAPQRLGPPLDGGVHRVAFAPDGETLATATATVGGEPDGTVLWDLTGLERLRADAMEQACAITGGGLSRAYWARYVPGLKFVDVCAT